MARPEKQNQAQDDFLEKLVAVNRTANDAPMLVEPLREPEVPQPKPAAQRAKKEKPKIDDGQTSLF